MIQQKIINDTPNKMDVYSDSQIEYVNYQQEYNQDPDFADVYYIDKPQQEYIITSTKKPSPKYDSESEEDLTTAFVWFINTYQIKFK